MAELVIQTQDLTKKYGTHVAVNGLTLSIHRGETFGLLGPNGSGKTTTILMMLGLTEPTSGTVQVLGLDPARRPLSVKSRVGYMPDEVGFYDELSAKDNLSYIARLNGIERPEAQRRIAHALETVRLAHVTDRPVGTFSRGMRQRLGVADVLIKEPQIIIMDEPTQGLDPEAGREFLNIIHSLKDRGITILLSSHLLAQVQAVCDRVGLFYHGKMVLEGTVETLSHQVLGTEYHIRLHALGSAEKLADSLKGLAVVKEVRELGENRYEILSTEDACADVAEAVSKSECRLMTLSMDNPTLEDVYARYFEEVNHGVGS